jgi:hypothetical protein
MPSIRPEDLTPFGRAALKLAQEFSELSRVGDQMSRADVESDNGLDEAVKILNRAAQHGESLAVAMQEFSASLNEARDQAEAATKLVAESAQRIQERRQQQEQIQEKLTQLKEDVKNAGTNLAAFEMPAKAPLTEDDKKRIAEQLERIQEPITRFIEAAQRIKEEAAGQNFKRLERQADSIIDSLQASRRKIAQALTPK